MRNKNLKLGHLTLSIDSRNPEKIYLQLSNKTLILDKKIIVLKQGQKDRILPGIIQFLKVQKVLPDGKYTAVKLSRIRVSAGQGNFTTTRLGVTIALALGLTLHVPVSVTKK